MELSTCSRCKKFFNYPGTGEKLCPACREAVEEDFQKVKSYIKEHPQNRIVEVAKDCEVPERQIRTWIREERLELSATVTDITCEACGMPIASGRYCEKCKAELANGLSKAVVKKEAKVETPKQKDNKNRMRFL